LIKSFFKLIGKAAEIASNWRRSDADSKRQYAMKAKRALSMGSGGKPFRIPSADPPETEPGLCRRGQNSPPENLDICEFERSHPGWQDSNSEMR
jgi:hypothetical protein